MNQELHISTFSWRVQFRLFFLGYAVDNFGLNILAVDIKLYTESHKIFKRSVINEPE